MKINLTDIDNSVPEIDYADVPLQFGKYEGFTLMEILNDHDDGSYIAWVADNIDSDMKLQSAALRLVEVYGLSSDSICNSPYDWGNDVLSDYIY